MSQAIYPALRGDEDIDWSTGDIKGKQMEITRQSLNVKVSLPVQFSAMRNGSDVTIYNVSVGGLYSLFDSLPEGVKLQITERLAEEVRGIK